MAQNQKVYVEKCQLVAMGIFRFAAFLTRFSSVRGFIFRLFKKNFFFFVFTVPLSDLASSLKCKLLFSSHTKVLLFRPHITRKKPKTFSMNIFFIKKMLLKAIQFQNRHEILSPDINVFPPKIEFLNYFFSWFFPSSKCLK